jgi:hypothetical protein
VHYAAAFHHDCQLRIAGGCFIGAPEVAGARFWSWQISSIRVEQTLTLWGLAFAAAGNAGAALFLIKGRKERKLCWEWAAVFGALPGAEYTFVHG